MATVVRKNSLLIGRNLWKNQARPFGGRVGERGVRLGKNRHTVKESQRNDNYYEHWESQSKQEVNM